VAYPIRTAAVVIARYDTLWPVEIISAVRYRRIAPVVEVSGAASSAEPLALGRYVVPLPLEEVHHGGVARRIVGVLVGGGYSHGRKK
ncbi:unnamed protein product, partial [Plutella xylostella]